MTAVASPAPARPEVLLIDLSSLFWTSYHATAASSSSEAAKLTQTAIDRCIGELDGKLVAICVDQGRSFRKGLSPDYKANRPEKDQSALAELAKLKEQLRDRGYWLVGADGFEADDVIATLATAASAAGHPIRIASADKDLLQLLALPDSSALRTHTWKTVRHADVVQQFGVEPDGLRDWLALVGDTSDNVKGCPSVGPKTATTLLVKHYDIDRLYARVEALGIATKTPAAAEVATPAVLEKLKAHKADVMLARQLVTLRTDAPVKFEDIYERREPKTTTKGEDMDEDKFDDDRISAPPAKEEPSPKAPETKSAESVAFSSPAANAVHSAGGAIASAQATGTNESRALAVVQAPYQRQLEPTSLGTAFKLGQALYESRLYTRFPTAQAITAVIMRGREMDLGALTALDCFHVVENKPCAYAYLIIARAKADPDCEFFQMTECSAESATWETKNRRNPKPTRYTYTIAMAIKAGLLMKEKGNWNTRPEDMLIKTAGAKLARIEYPAAALGLFSVEEMGGE